jgi:hypothetical protein
MTCGHNRCTITFKSFSDPMEVLRLTNEHNIWLKNNLLVAGAPSVSKPDDMLFSDTSTVISSGIDAYNFLNAWMAPPCTVHPKHLQKNRSIVRTKQCNKQRSEFVKKKAVYKTIMDNMLSSI